MNRAVRVRVRLGEVHYSPDAARSTTGEVSRRQSTSKAVEGFGPRPIPDGPFPIPGILVPVSDADLSARPATSISNNRVPPHQRWTRTRRRAGFTPYWERVWPQLLSRAY